MPKKKTTKYEGASSTKEKGAEEEQGYKKQAPLPKKKLIVEPTKLRHSNPTMQTAEGKKKKNPPKKKKKGERRGESEFGIKTESAQLKLI